MTVYWLSCLISCFFMKLVDINNKGIRRANKVVARCTFVLSIVPLTLVAALRYDVGQDYMYTYVPYFYRVTSHFEYEKLELLYHWLNKLVHLFSDDYVWVFAICAVIFMVLVYISILRDSPYPELSVFLLVGTTYYFIFLNCMRQLVGVSICLISLVFVEKRRFFPFLICMALAAGFHTSCLAFIPFYFLGRVKFGKQSIIVVTVIINIVATGIAGTLNQLIQATVYSGYQTSIFNTGEQGYIVLAMNFAVLIFAVVFYKKDDPKYQMYLNLQLIASWIAILTGKIVLIYRIRWMFGLPSIILLPMVIKNMPKKEDRIIAYMVIVILYAIYAQYTIGVMNGNNVLPYHTIFSRP